MAHADWATSSAVSGSGSERWEPGAPFPADSPVVFSVSSATRPQHSSPGFYCRAGGELVESSLRALGNGTEFAPGDLAEHQATAEPIRVWWRMAGTWVPRSSRLPM